MLVAYLSDRRIEASRELERRPDYICRGCGHRVVLRKGEVKIPHFAHLPNSYCLYATGETLAHLNAKVVLRDALRARGIRAEFEYVVGDQRADVILWSPSGNPLVVELQHTSLPVDDLRIRVRKYRQKRLSQIWVPFIKKECFAYHNHGIDARALALPYDGGTLDRSVSHTSVDRYPVRPFERWLSKVYDGTLWFYDETTQQFCKGSFSEYYIQTEGGYDLNAEYHDSVSYVSRRWRSLDLGLLRWPGDLRFSFTPGRYLGAEIVPDGALP